MTAPPTYATCLALGLLLSSCTQASDEGLYCQEDEDCSGICSRIQECIAADEVMELRLSWTIEGLAPTPSQPEACGDIVAFEVRLESDSSRDEVVAYFPVPCELGRTYYDKMPARFTRLRVSAVDRNDAVLDVAFGNTNQPSNDLLLDFRP